MPGHALDEPAEGVCPCGANATRSNGVCDVCAAYLAGIEHGRRLQSIEALAVISRLAGEAGDVTIDEQSAIVTNPKVAEGILNAECIDPSPRPHLLRASRRHFDDIPLPDPTT